MIKNCPICKNDFETIRKLKKYCSTKCYNKSNNNRTEAKNEMLRKTGYTPKQREHTTRCPTCGQTHYKRGYCMRDRIRCDYCENAVRSEYLVDTLQYEHRLYA